MTGCNDPRRNGADRDSDFDLRKWAVEKALSVSSQADALVLAERIYVFLKEGSVRAAGADNINDATVHIYGLVDGGKKETEAPGGG